MPKTVKFINVNSVIKKSGMPVSLEDLTTDNNIHELIEDIRKAYLDQDYIDGKTKILSPLNGNLREGFQTLEGNFISADSNVNLQAIFDFIYEIASQIDKYVNGVAPDLVNLPQLRTDIKSAIVATFDPLLEKIAALGKEVAAGVTGYIPINFAVKVNVADWPLTIAAGASDDISESTDENIRTAALDLLRLYFDKLDNAYANFVVDAAASYVKKFEESLALSYPVYQNIITGIQDTITCIPPGGAVAGAFPMTDRTRGVWKAPANVALSKVIAPEISFTASELNALNVDTANGKSINAIRSFPGKGTLIWGARTLDGNSNEWRYVSVRRLFIMVGESCRKSTLPFIFEPNDTNTWMKIRVMLENYLTGLWKQGALAGAKPEHAFYVKCGLGQTMTTQDIANGILIMEIGMASLRPAEFIILRFSHLKES